MRLADLDPKWIAHTGRHGMGVMFRCPCGTEACRYPNGLPIWFENPIDGGAPDLEVKNRWQRTGDTIETLTLAPSIFPPCWHGFVTNGQIRTV